MRLYRTRLSSSTVSVPLGDCVTLKEISLFKFPSRRTEIGVSVLTTTSREFTRLRFCQPLSPRKKPFHCIPAVVQLMKLTWLFCESENVVRQRSFSGTRTSLDIVDNVSNHTRVRNGASVEYSQHLTLWIS
jgi:hypothetical protein